MTRLDKHLTALFRLITPAKGSGYMSQEVQGTETAYITKSKG